MYKWLETDEQRWAYVSEKVDIMCKHTKCHDLADCLKAVLKEFNKDLVVGVAHQIWLEDRENNMLISIAYEDIVNALV